VAARALAAGVPLTQEPALADMFARKYANPEAYWREYESWWARWRVEPTYADIEAAGQATAAFYSK